MSEEEKGKPRVFWYIDLSSFEVEAPNGYAANRSAKEKIAAPDFEVEIADTSLARIVCCGEDVEEVYEKQEQAAGEAVTRMTGYRCKKCGTFLPVGSVEVYHMDREVCCECGTDVSPGSGRFVNRVHNMDDFAKRVQIGHPFPCGAYTCANCDEHPNDDVPVCEKIIGLSGIEKIIDVCARCEG